MASEHTSDNAWCFGLRWWLPKQLQPSPVERQGRSARSGVQAEDDQDQEFKSKMIKRLAHQREIYSVRGKEGQEAMAKWQGANKRAPILTINWNFIVSNTR